MNHKVMVLKDAKPCHLCDGELVLDSFNPPNGVVRCRGCGHRFDVVVGVVEHPPRPKVDFETRVTVDFTGEGEK